MMNNILRIQRVARSYFAKREVRRKERTCYYVIYCKREQVESETLLFTLHKLIIKESKGDSSVRLFV
jgi:hypothetical protein